MGTLLELGWAAVAIGLSAAALGCSMTIAIRPDQLPILTNAAAAPVPEPQEVIGASGRMARGEGTLEKVEVTGPDGVKIFSAPLRSKVDGPMLFIRDEERLETFPLAYTQRVKVTYADKDAKLAGGVVLDILGGLVIAGGITMIGVGAAADARSGGGFGLGGLVAVVYGVPLLLAGSGILVPGILLTKSGANRPQYGPRPASE